jgi:hypothetical protein
MNARHILNYLNQLCRDIDEGRPLKRFAPAVAKVALPAMLGLSSMAFIGCGPSQHERTDPNQVIAREVGTDPSDRDGDGLIDNDDHDYNPDSNPQPVAPRRVEICGDGIDNDQDGDTDCRDIDCSVIPDCQVSVTLYAAPEMPAQIIEQEICNDRLDNDGDGRTDCADPDCTGQEYCGPPPSAEVCDDGQDNDRDGLTDCADADCRRFDLCEPQPVLYAAPPPPPMPEICDDGRDNDGDGLIDRRDPDCGPIDLPQPLYGVPFDR